MGRRAVIIVDGEVLTNFCQDCQCCLAKKGHCWNCHTTMSIDDLCGPECKICPELVDDFAEREAERIRARSWRSSTKLRAKNQ